MSKIFLQDLKEVKAPNRKNQQSRENKRQHGILSHSVAQVQKVKKQQSWIEAAKIKVEMEKIKMIIVNQLIISYINLCLIWQLEENHRNWKVYYQKIWIKLLTISMNFSPTNPITMKFNFIMCYMQSRTRSRSNWFFIGRRG